LYNVAFKRWLVALANCNRKTEGIITTTR
jgi:hypothetical protein